MPPKGFLHSHASFPDLIRIVGRDLSIDPGLVEKDYWIMHCLYGLQREGWIFQLKGGTSLSKGFGIINRFSEDIDIRIEPPEGTVVKTGPNHTKAQHCESRKLFYDSLAQTIEIEGIENVRRDTDFDDDKYWSGGIRLEYSGTVTAVPGLKDGILLEVGFKNVAPNEPKDISSWAYDYAAAKEPIIDNRARGVKCYHPGYTLIEKLQAICTKYRSQQKKGSSLPDNFLRHYYDVYCLLKHPAVKDFIGTSKYYEYKAKHFPKADRLITIAENEAFILSDVATRNAYEKEYLGSHALYYRDQPSFSDILHKIQEHSGSL